MIDATHTTFKYSGIESKEEIRVLSLQPSLDFAAPLRATLVRRSLSTWVEDVVQLPYEAISYCWGGLPQTFILSCDGQNLPITQNVDSILRHLRKPLKERYLWIDAVCINQMDNMEKSHQVQNMGAIFSRAEKVHVWLGDAAEDDQIPQTFALLKHMVLSKENGAFTKNIFLETNLKHRVFSILSRPWFQRRWVLQEVALGHNVTLRCGSHKISWEWFRKATATLLNKVYEGHNGSPDLTTEVFYALQSSVLLQPRTQDLMGLLHSFHRSQCADNRDRLFSLYSFVVEETYYSLPGPQYVYCPVDYSVHWVEIYTRYTKEIVKAGFFGRIYLHLVNFGNLGQQNPEWPSWVPSWNKERFRKFPDHIQPPIEGYDKLVQIEGKEGIQMSGCLEQVLSPQELAPDFRGLVVPENNSIMSQLTALAATIRSHTPVICRGYMEDNGSDMGFVVEALLDADNLLRHEGISFGRIFGRSAMVLPPLMDYKKLLSETLKQYFCLEKSSHIRFDSEALQHEVGRVLEGSKILYCRVRSQLKPVLSPRDAQSGDYIFRRGQSSEFFNNNSIMLFRRCQEWSSNEEDKYKLFRIVGDGFHDTQFVHPDFTEDFLVIKERFKELEDIVLI